MSEKGNEKGTKKDSESCNQKLEPKLSLQNLISKNWMN